MKNKIIIQTLIAMLFFSAMVFPGCSKGTATESTPVIIQSVKQKGSSDCLYPVWPEPVKGYINTFYAPMGKGGC